MRVSQVLIKLGKVLHRDAAATANEPSPGLIRERFISALLLLAERSGLAGRYGRVHTYTLPLRRSGIGILNSDCSAIIAFKHNYFKLHIFSELNTSREETHLNNLLGL